jgi:cupin superfamily acireductone dioxygenase involved in methionine salvage
MKLIFEKNSDKEITVKLANGTIVEEFSYTQMIKQLLKKNNFDDSDYININADEQLRIQEMLKKINSAIESEEN